MNEQTESVLDILNQDLTDVDMSNPLLPKGDYPLEVKKVEQVESKNKPGNYLVKIQLATTEDYQSVSGEPIPKGTYLFDQISLTPTEKYTKLNIQKRCKAFRQACTGETSGAFGPLEQYVGRTVNARVRIDEADDNYPARNSIARYNT